MPNVEKDCFYFKLAEKKKAANWVISQAGKSVLWCFYGEMGVGKTTLITEICKQFEVVSEMNSPTFSLVNEYHCKSGKKIFHFDFYRIKSIEEVYDMGFEMYFDSGEICLIEWPEKIEEILVNEDTVSFQLEVFGDQRQIEMK